MLFRTSQPFRPARDRADAPQHPVREIRRPQVPRRRARQGHAGAAALRREPARPRRRLPRAAAAARRRPGIGAARARRDGDAPPIRSRRLAKLPAPPRAGEDWTELRRRRWRSSSAARPAGPPSSNARGSGTSRIWTASTRTPRSAAPISLQLEQIAARLSVARALPHRADARSARRHQRPGRRAAARRGLPDPLDHPFGQGPGVEVGLRAQRRRRLHPVRPRHRHDAPRSRRSGACSTSR